MASRFGARVGQRQVAAAVARAVAGAHGGAGERSAQDEGEQAAADQVRMGVGVIARGGYVPAATELLAAADRVKLAGTIDDSPLTASIDEDKSDGLKDRREMSSTLATTSSGSSAAGSNGVTQGSKGDPRQGEPDPVPLPADPYPSTLQYVTVYDNRDKGGFAGSKPVTQPELFRCAFNKAQGAAAAEIDNPGGS